MGKTWYESDEPEPEHEHEPGDLHSEMHKNIKGLYLSLTVELIIAPTIILEVLLGLSFGNLGVLKTKDAY